MQAAKPQQGAGELEQAQEVSRALVVTNEQRAALRKPRQRAFDDPAPRWEALLAGRQIELLLPNTAQVRDVLVAGPRRRAGGVAVAQVQTQTLWPLRRRLAPLPHQGVQGRR